MCYENRIPGFPDELSAGPGRTADPSAALGMTKGRARFSSACYLLRTVKLFGAAQEAGRARTAYVLHHSRDKYAVPASLPQKAAFYGIGIPTADELACVTNHFPFIFFAVPSRSTWLFAVQLGRPVAEFNDTSK